MSEGYYGDDTGIIVIQSKPYQVARAKVDPVIYEFRPLIPYSKPVAALVGKPIRIDTPEPNPSNERVDELHAQCLV